MMLAEAEIKPQALGFAQRWEAPCVKVPLLCAANCGQGLIGVLHGNTFTTPWGEGEP